MLLYIAYNKEWKQKTSDEVQSLIQKHTNTNPLPPPEPLHKRLSTIPISVWEKEMPVLDSVIRETLRMVQNFTALRRNILNDLDIRGEVIPKGDFIAYPVSDAHQNPDIYTNPMKFDPDRFSVAREEDKKQAHAFLGWGAGKLFVPPVLFSTHY
jgi:sterol 14-demethylase